MNQPYSSNQKSQNAKFVIVTALVTLVILGIAVWGIVFVANYQNKGNGEVAYTDASSSSVAPVSTSDQTESTTPENTEPESTEGVSAATENNNTPAPTSTPPQSCPPSCKNKTADSGTNNSGSGSASTTSVPNTGPEDFLPVVLLLGVFVAFLTSQNLVKRDII